MGQTVKVKVIGVDPVKNRINLSIKQASGYISQQPAGADKSARQQKKPGAAKGAKKPDRQNNLDAMLKALQNKFNRK